MLGLVCTAVPLPSNVLFAESVTRVNGNLLAFPGAQGFGRFASGGRDGKVVFVTNTNDSGSGSLRHALEVEQGPRTVIFRTGGIITARTHLNIRDNNVTVAGQTAPGGGITIRGGGLQVRGSNIIVRGLRLRPGDGEDGPVGDQRDGFMLVGSNIMFDHNSVSWGVDENGSLFGTASNITVSNNIISEGLFSSIHPKSIADPNQHHSMGFLIGDNKSNISIYRNLFASNYWRNPIVIGGGQRGIEIVNNYAYNCFACMGVDRKSGFPDTQVHFISNAIDSGGFGTGSRFYSNSQQVYAQGNTAFPSREPILPSMTNRTAASPLFASSILNSAILPATDLLPDLQTTVGARWPVRDSVDTRVINNTVNRLQQGRTGIPDSPADVGGYPVVARGVAPDDSDNDGIPNEFEDDVGGNPNQADNNVRHSSGYTRLEVYLNGIISGEFNPSTVNGTDTTGGVTSIVGTVVTAIDNLNVRTAPGTASSVITTIPAGTQCTITGVPQTAQSARLMTTTLASATQLPLTVQAATTPQYNFTISTLRYVSAAGGSATGAAVSVTNNNVGAALTAGKNRPYASLEEAVRGVTPGTIIVVGPGIYTLSEQLPLSTQGTADQPIILLSEVDRAAIIRGGTGNGPNGRALTLLGGNHWHVHNFRIEGHASTSGTNDSNPIQIVGSDSNVRAGSILIAGNHITGQSSDDMIKGTTVRGVRIVGNRIEPSVPVDESGIDFVSVFDFEVSRNTFRGTYGAGGAFQAKGGSQRGLVFRNDFEITPPVGLVLGAGGFGGSRVTRDMPFENPADDYRFAEAHEITYLENRIAPNTSRAQPMFGIDGGTNISFIRNFIDGRAGQTAFREQSGQASPWQNQGTQIPSQYSQYVTYNGSTFTYESRRNTYRGNRWTNGMIGFAGIQEPIAQTDNQVGTSPFTGGVGENTWDRGAIYRALLLPVSGNTPSFADVPPGSREAIGGGGGSSAVGINPFSGQNVWLAVTCTGGIAGYVSADFVSFPVNLTIPPVETLPEDTTRATVPLDDGDTLTRITLEACTPTDWSMKMEYLGGRTDTIQSGSPRANEMVESLGGITTFSTLFWRYYNEAIVAPNPATVMNPYVADLTELPLAEVNALMRYKLDSCGNEGTGSSWSWFNNEAFGD
jgi:hypothetical protein